MKKVYLLLILAFLSINNLCAATHIVNVSNFQFSNANFTANIGDVVKFNWVSGFHTTTSTSTPSGAASWDAPMDGSNTTFSYTITTAGVYNYVCSFHSNMVGTFTVNGALPVKLTSFDVSENKNGTKISWKTTSELNADYFSLRRSNSNADFKEIAKIKAAGNSLEEKVYSYDDLTLNTTDPFFYYVLATVDKDGSEQYSDIKFFKNKLTVSTKLITSIFPNPLNKGDHLMISYAATINGKMNIKFRNVNGKLVYEDNIAAFIGMNNSHLMLPDLKSGIYIATFSLGDVKEIHKIQVN